MAAQRVAAAPKAVFHPPASQFAELLRRSKFASYDPAIRQTYQAPPANAHRGDWGVKRPISLRRKNAFISLTSFEHHAHFTEWNHAENQVRFIRRIEEMGGKAEMYKTTPWYRSLGLARSEPPIDSDICPGEDDELVTIIREKQAVRLPEKQTAEQPMVQTAQPQTVNLTYLGKRGPGAYGTQRQEPVRDVAEKDIFITHNIHAMSKREFKRYLRSLRAQRPEFQEFVNSKKEIKEKDLYALAKQDNDMFYRRFLQSQMSKGYADYSSTRIQPQPHPNGALLYTAPTSLEMQFWTQAKPGFYLNQADTSDNKNPNFYKFDPRISDVGDLNHVVSFGGLTTRVGNGAVVGKKVLLDKAQEEGVRQEDIEKSILDLKVDPFEPIKIRRLPCTVGNKPEGLKAVLMELKLIQDTEPITWSNPHAPGSRDYIAMDPNLKTAPRPLRRSRPTKNPLLSTASGFTGEKGNPEELLTTLKTLVKPGQREL